MGRSYGGYMTLTLAGRHPELWSAAVDMFGPYNLLTFMDRMPETWKTYFHMAVGDPEKDQEFLTERSPSTYLDQPGLPAAGHPGRRTTRAWSSVNRATWSTPAGEGKEVEYLVFEDEGHDVLKFANKVDCYGRITGFFVGILKP